MWNRIKEFYEALKGVWDYTVNDGGQFGAADIFDDSSNEEKDSHQITDE